MRSVIAVVSWVALCLAPAAFTGCKPKASPGADASVVTSAPDASAATSASVAPLASALAAPPGDPEPVDAGSGDAGAKSTCIQPAPDDSTTATLSGMLVVDAAFVDPDGKHARPWILKLDAPRCVDFEAGMKSVVEAHVAPYPDKTTNKTMSMKPLVGKHVTLTGFPMEWQTGWHARPLVLMTTEGRATPK